MQRYRCPKCGYAFYGKFTRCPHCKVPFHFQGDPLPEPKNNEELDKIMDTINNKYGKNIIKRASYIERDRF